MLFQMQNKVNMLSAFASIFCNECQENAPTYINHLVAIPICLIQPRQESRKTLWIEGRHLLSYKVPKMPPRKAKDQNKFLVFAVKLLGCLFFRLRVP